MSVEIRELREEDGGAVWELVQGSGKLDVNSAYCYLMLGRWFRETCAAAIQDGRVIGFVSGFRQPERPAVWFVWQICVDGSARGQGIGRRMLEEVLARPANRDIRYMEATVSPSNASSNALFHRLAQDLNAECTVTEGFSSGLFPGSAHEDEPLLRIGPINQKNH